MERAIEKNYTCPICGKKSLFVGVHDDEGNYRGMLGCEYEQDPWSGLAYALHHDGWGDCVLCTDGSNEVMGGILFNTAQEAADALPTLPQPSNEWVSVENAVPEPGERVLASDGIFVGEAYRTSANSWYRHTGCPWRDGVTGRTVRYWMYMPNPFDCRPPEGEA